MAEVLAKVGGILKVFLVVFIFLTDFISEKFYKIEVINQIFQFKNNNTNSNNDDTSKKR